MNYIDNEDYSFISNRESRELLIRHRKHIAYRKLVDKEKALLNREGK